VKPGPMSPRNGGGLDDRYRKFAPAKNSATGGGRSRATAQISNKSAAPPPLTPVPPPPITLGNATGACSVACYVACAVTTNCW